MFNLLFTGTGSLFRFMLRRDRIRLTIWLFAISVFTIAMAPYYADMYPTAEARAVMAETMNNPAVVMLCGPVYSADDYHAGAILANNTLLFIAAFIAVMNIFLIARHTRQDEETGRMEVIRSLPVGKLANIAAAILLALGANAVLILVIGLGITACGVDSMGFLGAMNYAAAMGFVGIFFAFVTAVCCQLSANNKTAAGLTLAITGASYLLRGIGDTGGIKALTLTSPFGLAHLTETFAGNYWWPIMVMLGASIVLGVIALRLAAVRDLGAGLLPAKPGRKTASALLGSSLGLSLRLLRSSILIWVGVILVFAGIFGSLFGDFETLVTSNEMIAAYFANTDFTITEEFMTLLIALFAITGVFPSLSYLMKLRNEEKTGHTELVLSQSVGKHSLFAGYYILAVINAVLLSIIGAAALWAAASAVIEDAPAFSTILSASLYYVPAVWLIVGASGVLIGLFPKAAGAALGYLGYCFISMITVMMFGFPDWLGWLSPFSFVPQIPVEAAHPAVAVVLIGISIALSFAGFIGYKNRDAVFY